MNFWIFIFWASVFALIYPYAVYPLLLACLVAVRGQREPDYPRRQPKVSLLIPAHNEEAVIGEKVATTLALDYPPEKLEVVVISDGSTDQTDRILSGFADPRLIIIRQEKNRGKNQALNRALGLASGELIVFTDANAIFAPDALEELVRPFADPRIGCAVGRLRYGNPKHSPIGRLEIAYWTLENLLKSGEGRLGALIGANGSIFAIRRRLWEPLDDSVHEDFIIPMKILLQGHRVVYRPSAVAREETATAAEQEFKRRARIVWKGWTAIGMVWPRLFRPFRPLLIFELFSRKICKRLLWLFMFLLLLAPLFLLDRPFYRVVFILQAVFAAAAGIGRAGRGARKKNPLFYYPYAIWGLSLANLAGFLDFIRGRKPAGAWEVQRPLDEA
ncbi:MAG: glycosyltransferase family 2 protein [Candidatus Erginobacter occultus]|nr:glycosyltransferase family 2 protein [Candidatus Erginobacter occultus]